MGDVTSIRRFDDAAFSIETAAHNRVRAGAAGENSIWMDDFALDRTVKILHDLYEAAMEAPRNTPAAQRIGQLGGLDPELVAKDALTVMFELFVAREVFKLLRATNQAQGSPDPSA